MFFVGKRILLDALFQRARLETITLKTGVTFISYHTVQSKYYLFCCLFVFNPDLDCRCKPTSLPNEELF